MSATMPARTGRPTVAEPRLRSAATDATFATFYEREFRAVVGLIYTLSGSWGVAEDLAQEAFVRAYRDWSKVGGFARPDSWVRTVAVNLATSRGRRLASEARAVTRLRARRPVVHHDPLPDDAEGFWQAVRRLPPRQAQAVALRYHGELSVAEIASAMDCAEGTVKAHLHAARTTLAPGERPAGPTTATTDIRTPERPDHGEDQGT